MTYAAASYDALVEGATCYICMKFGIDTAYTTSEMIEVTYSQTSSVVYPTEQ